MPKEVSSARFRKGTKSCIECRQRKLRCIPSADESQPCQNCAARGRTCILQVHAGRNSDAPGITSRDRISQLEDNVATLWAVVRELKTELGHPQDDTFQSTGPSTRMAAADSDWDTSDTSPMNPPTHLQQLFENEILDSRGNDFSSLDNSSPDKASSAMITRARTRLQAVMPPKEDVQVISSMTSTWIPLYNALFPTVNMFASGHEMLSNYNAVQDPDDANPAFVAALLLSIALTVIQQPPDSLNLKGIKDAPSFVRHVSAVVDEVIVSSDSMCSTIEGIETALLWLRL